MPRILLFCLLFLSCLPLWAQDSTAVQGDSSHIAGWSLSYCFTEPLFSGHRFRLEGNLSPKKGHWRYFFAPAYFGAMLEESRFTQNELPITEPEVTEFEGQSRLRGAGLELGVVLRPNGKAFYSEIKGLSQGYLQFSVGGSLLSREFEDATWVVRNGVYRPGFAKLRERLYRTDLMLGGGVRVHTYFKGFVDFYFGLAYRHAWQAETLNEGWRETDNTFFALNYTGISPRMRMRIGWTHPRGEKRFVPTPQRKIRFEENQKARREAYLKQREAERASYRARLKSTTKTEETKEEKKRRWAMTEEERLRQDSIALAHRIRAPQKKWLEIQDSAFYGKWAMGLNLHPLAMNALQPEFCLAVFTDSARAHMTHFYASPAVYLPLNATLERPRQGWGLQVGVRQRFGGLPFHFHTKKLQGYVDYFVGYHRTAGEMLVEVDAQPFPFEEVQDLHMRRADFGLGFGARLCGKKAFYLDFFGAFVYRLAWSPELEEREGKHSVDDDFMNPLFQGIAPQLGLRMGFMKMSQRRQYFTRKVEEK